MDFKAKFEEKLAEREPSYIVKGVITADDLIYPLGSDTKVLSTIFESIARPLVYSIAADHGLDVWEPRVQNSYPDFTLMENEEDEAKIAVDVKTTYRDGEHDRVSFTLGGYTSFLRSENKNIEFPYSQYAAHWVIGYIYRRWPADQPPAHAYRVDQIDEVPPPYRDVQVFVQEKWRIAGDSAGSGNTTNIGSIRGRLADFEAGNGVFQTYEEYLDYWRNYERTAAERADKFSNVNQYRVWRGNGA